MTTEPTLGCDLYRFYDGEERLLYVGISLSAITRANQHRHEKGWWADVRRMDIEQHPTRDAALAAERAAIIAEKPQHNVVHNDGRQGPTPERIDGYGEPIDYGAADSLIGWFFHTYENDGETISRQGRVIAGVGIGVYLVVWYSWGWGEELGGALRNLDEMKGWQFYRTNADMDAEYVKYDRRRSIRPSEPSLSIVDWKQAFNRHSVTTKNG